jgi:hypothetical protein
MTTRSPTERSDIRIAWWVLSVEFILLAGAGLGIGIFFFSLLPLSVALLVSMVALLTFPVARSRVESWQHIAIAIAMWIILSATFLILIFSFGREPFQWLLDWD